MHSPTEDNRSRARTPYISELPYDKF